MCSKTLFPNASVLSIITSESNLDTHDILFIAVKPVPDEYQDDKPFWYSTTGQNGKSKTIWTDLKVKHWFAIGKDDQIKTIYEHILLVHAYEIGSKSVKFKVPDFTKKIYKPDPFLDRSQNEAEQLIIVDMGHFPQSFFQKENLAILSGYQVSDSNIKPLFPTGFYEKNEIYNHLSNKVFGMAEIRKPYLTFHGKRDKKKTGSTSGMVGFYQAHFATDKTYTAVFNDKIGAELGRSDINQKNGIFESFFDDQDGKGSVTVLIDGIAVKKLDYTLIKDIKFDVNIASGTLKDAYDRDHMQIKKKVRPETISAYTWQKEVYSNNRDANMKLSDKFIEVFDYLGPSILIVDPYYIGDIKIDALTNQLKLSDCQLSFLNALVTGAVMGSLSELIVMGSNGRANDHATKDPTLTTTTSEQRFERYEKLFKTFITANKLENYLPANSTQFKNSPEDFHNRYWFSLSADKKKLNRCVVVTTSIGNMFEVDFIPVTDPAQCTQITMKFINLFKLSKDELTV